jgi:ABC-type multidrug transport system ATPase subunit
MEIILRNASKRYGREVIFQDVDRTLSPGSRTAILGPNGSGKSTLLQLVSGAITATGGTVEHRMNGKLLEEHELYPYVSIAAPYLGLYEDLSLEQVISFHARFKPLRTGISCSDLADIAYLDHALHKPVLHFSSGMKQRLKLALAILSDTPLLLLDEPASNLDADAITWFRTLLAGHLDGRTLLVASNRQAQEHDLCTERIEIMDHKPA